MTDYPPHPTIAKQLGIPGATDCVCATPAAAMRCAYGHMLECHYPLTCEQANCSHYRRTFAPGEE